MGRTFHALPTRSAWGMKGAKFIVDCVPTVLAH